MAELSKLPTAYRRAVFNELTPAARRALWREHIGGFLRGQPQLTPAQRQLASEVMQLFDSLAAAKPGDGILEDMVTRVNAVYPKDLAGRVFMQLGESDETDSPAGVSGGVQQASVLNWLATPLTVVRSLGSKAHTGSVACSCNTGVNSCGMVCGGSGLCDIQEIGCGFLWFYGCNGTCGPWRGREDAIQ